MTPSLEESAKSEWKVRSLQACIDSMAEKQRARTLDTFGIDKKVVDPAQRGWLKVARFASHLSTNEVARRLGISRPAYSRAEASELRGTITIATMQRLADSLNCDFVYELRPREGEFAEKIWQQICPIATRHPRFWRRAQPVCARELATISACQMLDPQTRRDLSWTERLKPK